jgi:thioredoxin reductase
LSRYVVLAMGRRGAPRKLGVPGEELPKVIYQLIDAKSYSGKHLLVVGGGDSAVEAAVGLARQHGNTVTVSYRKSAFFRVKKKNEIAIEKMISAKKVIPIFDSEVTEITPSTVVLKTKSGTTEIPNDHVIVLIGGVPPFELLRSVGIQFGGDQKPITLVRNAV